MKELIVLSENVKESRAKQLYNEFSFAWEKTSFRDELFWLTRCV